MKNRISISIDFWDTLVTRNVFPNELKLLRDREWAKILNISANEMHELVNEVDTSVSKRNLARGGDEESSLEQIIQELLDILHIKQKKSISNKLMECALKIEIQFSRPLFNSLPEFLDFLGLDLAEIKHGSVISDFYLGSEQLKKIIEKTVPWVEGLPNFILISSADVGLTKRSGRLFARYVSDLEIEVANHLHIGDNPESDGRRAKESGMSVKITPSPDLINQEAIVTERLRIDLDGTKPANWNHERLLGANTDLPSELALLLASFSLWLEYQFNNKKKNVYFMLREGATLQHSFAKTNYSFETSLLNLNRTIALRLNAAKGIEWPALANLIHQYPKIDLEMYARFTGYEISDSDLAIGVNLKTNPVGKLRLFHENHRDQVEKANELDNFHGLIDRFDEVNLIDVGWRGSVAHSVELLMENTAVKSFLMFGWDAIPTCDGSDPRVINRVFIPAENFIDYKNPQRVIEKALTPNVPSSYDSNGNVLDSAFDELGDLQLLQELRKHSLNLVTSYIQSLRKFSYTESELQAIGLSAVKSFYKKAGKSSKKRILWNEHNESFGGLKIKKHKRPSLEEILLRMKYSKELQIKSIHIIIVGDCDFCAIASFQSALGKFRDLTFSYVASKKLIGLKYEALIARQNIRDYRIPSISKIHGVLEQIFNYIGEDSYLIMEAGDLLISETISAPRENGGHSCAQVVTRHLERSKKHQMELNKFFERSGGLRSSGALGDVQDSSQLKKLASLAISGCAIDCSSSAPHKISRIR